VPPATSSQIKTRIGDMGYPTEVWVVRTLSRFPIETVCFFDRAKAKAFADEQPDVRQLKPTPIRVVDA
jgi:hypothetical protein